MHNIQGDKNIPKYLKRSFLMRMLIFTLIHISKESLVKEKKTENDLRFDIILPVSWSIVTILPLELDRKCTWSEKTSKIFVNTPVYLIFLKNFTRPKKRLFPRKNYAKIIHHDQADKNYSL